MKKTMVNFSEAHPRIDAALSRLIREEDLELHPFVIIQKIPTDSAPFVQFCSSPLGIHFDVPMLGIVADMAHPTPPRSAATLAMRTLRELGVDDSDSVVIIEDKDSIGPRKRFQKWMDEIRQGLADLVASW